MEKLARWGLAFPKESAAFIFRVEKVGSSRLF
jgi:hypothetical protein